MWFLNLILCQVVSRATPVTDRGGKLCVLDLLRPGQRKSDSINWIFASFEDKFANVEVCNINDANPSGVHQVICGVTVPFHMDRHPGQIWVDKNRFNLV